MATRKVFRQFWRPVSKLCTGELTTTPIRRTIQTSAKHAHPFSGKEHIRHPPKRNGQILALTSGGVLTILLGSQVAYSSHDKNVPEPPPSHETTVNPQPHTEPEPQTELKEGVQYYRLDEIRSHDGASARPWVTRGTSVYDITDWIPAHPGGEVILRACGGSLDPYWDIFSIHKRKDVYEILEEYKIGEISPHDLVDGKLPAATVPDPFVADPDRDPRLLTLTARPRNAETPPDGLSPFLTPTPLFYVRNHMWVPPPDDNDHSLTITLPSGDEKTYTLEDLKSRFPTHTVTATLQCSGNRRADMTRAVPDKGTNGLQWEVGAISCAEWTGVKLRDVLADAGLDLASPGPDAKHAQFEGAEAYGASIPLSKVLDSQGDVLLAFGMNGAALPADHGFPLRVIVPGNVAARSVKWLKKITVSDEESTTQWQRRDYKCFGPNVAKPDWSKAPSIQEMPVTSAITRIERPEAGGKVNVEGYAYSGGGREIVRVDVSIDHGKTWAQAELMGDEGKGSKSWWWKRWRFVIPDEGDKGGEVLVKATDESYNTQPEDYRGIWNQRGNLSCAWHGVHVGPGEAANAVKAAEK